MRLLIDVKLPAVKLETEIVTSSIEDTLPTANVDVLTERSLGVASLVREPVIETVALLLVMTLLPVNVVLPVR